nr:OmpW family outer membrane protein [uncultured Aquabacterium sp.]
MNLKTRSQVCLSLALFGAFASQPMTAYAQSQLAPLFANAEPRLRERMFMRLDYIRANVKTTSSDVRDVTGPVITPDDLKKAGSSSFLSEYAGASGTPGTLAQIRARYNSTLFTSLRDGLQADVDAGYACEAGGLGTPCGTRARSQAMIGTPAVSIGYYLDDEFSWALEGFVLAKPIDVTIQGDGPTSLNGKDIIKLKLLPPVVKLGHYFGSKRDVIRPYVGLLGSYAVFYDVKATSTLNSYVGGSNPNDTTIGIKNAFGWGWMLGARAEVNEDWHLAFNIGKIRYKTEATITTHNTVITGNSAVLQDYGPRAVEAVTAGESTVLHGQKGVTQLMCDVARAKYGNTSCNHGSFTRKASNVLDNTLFVLSVGRTF